MYIFLLMIYILLLIYFFGLGLIENCVSVNYQKSVTLIIYKYTFILISYICILCICMYINMDVFELKDSQTFLSRSFVHRNNLTLRFIVDITLIRPQINFHDLILFHVVQKMSLIIFYINLF